MDFILQIESWLDVQANQTSKQWTPGLKFISATTTKNFGQKLFLNNKNKKIFLKKNFFSEKIWKNKFEEKKFLKKI